MSGNERIRMVPIVNSRLPTCAHCEFNGYWSWRLYGLCWRCTLVYRLYIMARLKRQQKCANAADRDDRVQSVRNRVYSIIYRCSISVQFVGVQFFLFRVNRACKTNTSMTVDNNLDELLEAAVVELPLLRVDRDRVRVRVRNKQTNKQLNTPRTMAVGSRPYPWASTSIPAPSAA